MKRWGNHGAVANVRRDLDAQRFSVERVAALERRLGPAGPRREDHSAA